MWRRCSLRTLVAGAVLGLVLSGCSSTDEDLPATSPPDPSSPSAASPSDDVSEPADPAPRSFSLAVTGDVLLHPTLIDEAESAAGADGEHDFLPLLTELEPFVADADVALCNLETPIGEPPYQGYPMFTVPEQILIDLAEIGYDGCTTATNHTLDDGVDGVERTLDSLDDAGLFATGSYRTEEESKEPPLLDVPGSQSEIQLGVITATYSLNGLQADTPWRADTDLSASSLIQRGESARAAGADVVVAAVHDGAEYSTRPTDSQRQLGQELAASGVFDFVYMHHTHSVLPIELHEGTWIVYGLGNSVAKHATPTVLNREGISVRATFVENADTDDDAAWQVEELAWAPHWLTEDPVRWCPVDPDASGGSDCAPGAQDALADSWERSAETVDAYGAIEDGLVLWSP
ncbi:MAG: CapA family protein [Micrococcaceae bacterium]